MTLPEYAIEIEGLRKTYAATKRQPGKEALKGVDLKIRRGSIFGLLVVLLGLFLPQIFPHLRGH